MLVCCWVTLAQSFTYRWKVWKSHVLVQRTGPCRKRLCGKLSLTVYSLVMILVVYGVLEGLLFLTLNLTFSIKLTCRCIGLRMSFPLSSISVFVSSKLVPFYLSVRSCIHLHDHRLNLFFSSFFPFTG